MSDEFLGRPSTDPESPHACLWDAMESLDEILYKDPHNISALSAIWMIQEAIIKLMEGDPFDHPSREAEMRELFELKRREQASVNAKT